MTLTAFHPTIARWFEETLGEPTAPQREGWPRIRAGEHVLIAAPTGTGKTLAAFLSALDGLVRQGPRLRDECQVVYVSPLRALSNDVQKNLAGPLEALRALDPTLPEVRVLVRTGDTTSSARAAMLRKPPHVLVTTPESLYILLTSQGGRAMLASARTLIVDEIHALARDKRGSHLALSLERLDDLVARSGGRLQRIGLSATQKPLSTVSRLLVGAGRECALVDAGHLRAIDLDVVVPPSPLSHVCSHEQWDEIYQAMAGLIEAHRTTLVFANTRKLAERLAARLSEKLGKGVVGCHHGSLSKETRLEAEQKLKRGELRALVATASLELGIDIGDVDLVLQVASPRSIATLLQRVGRAGHGVARTPKGRLFPLTLDEAVEALALVRAVRRGALDRTPEPPPALDILIQQLVAACVGAGDEDAWSEDALYALARRASPYRHLARADFDAALDLHARGPRALLHRDQVKGRVRATKRARIPAVTSGGAIPDNADYRVLVEPAGTFVGTLNEDFAIESNVNDVFQLGNASWRVLKVEPGVVRVADAEGAPPTLPFWLGEAPARTDELSEEIGVVRERGVELGWLRAECGASRELGEQVAEYLAEGRRALGAIPTRRRVVIERFFDESGGMQMVVHSLYGGRINRALGLGLRKRICRRFGFELQAAANEEAIVISLGLQHSFELPSVFDWLDPRTARDLLVQALLPAPMFGTRWRWNAMRSLLLPRMRGGRPVAPQLQRMRAEDLLAASFPQAVACGETLPPGDLVVPMEHPIVRQTVEDCLSEAMDADGFVRLLEDLADDRVEKVAVDVLEPSPFARAILAAQPYAFLDDAPLEERRTQAVMTRRAREPQGPDDVGALDPAVVARVRAEAWPDPASAEELHEALTWIGFVTDEEVEASGWRAWLAELAGEGRVERSGERWLAAGAPRAGKEVLRGRLEALGPVLDGDALLEEFAGEARELEAEGFCLRARFPVVEADGSHATPPEQRLGWCARRLLARIHRATLERLRREIEPVTAAEFLRFLCAWQHVAPATRLEGPRGVLAAVRQLAGFHAPAEEWERHLLPARVAGYRREWLDALAFSGEVAWGRLAGAGASAAKSTPVALFPREDLETWLAIAEPADARGVAEGGPLHSDALALLEILTQRGACFRQELARASGLLPTRLDDALAVLAGHGLATCDSFAGLRSLYAAHSTARRGAADEIAPAAGRWTTFRRAGASGAATAGSPARTPGRAHDPGAEPALVEHVARTLLARTGVVFRKTLARERLGIDWRDLLRVYRRMEARGEIHGGRFVAGFAGEQYALPEAVKELRRIRKEPGEPVAVAASDPLNLVGILTPDERVAANARTKVALPVAG